MYVTNVSEWERQRKIERQRGRNIGIFIRESIVI